MPIIIPAYLYVNLFILILFPVCVLLIFIVYRNHFPPQFRFLLCCLLPLRYVLVSIFIHFIPILIPIEAAPEGALYYIIYSMRGGRLFPELPDFSVFRYSYLSF